MFRQTKKTVSARPTPNPDLQIPVQHLASMKAKMELHYHSQRNQSHRAALAGAFLLLFPLFFPNLFHPLGRASPSLFSVRSGMDFPKTDAPDATKQCFASYHEIRRPGKDLVSIAKSRMEALCDPYKRGIITKKISRLHPSVPRWRIESAKNGIAVARILNATLVVPYLEVNAVWKDSSSFAEIFDVDHFIDVLSDDISIVKELPIEYSWSTREYYATGIRNTRIKTAPTHASASWYLENVLPALQSYGIAAISPFSHRLSFNDLPIEIQHLRCKVNFEALTFVRGIIELGETIINRLRYPRNGNEVEGTENLPEDETRKLEGGKFVALHLRFDKDMAAHSACDFGGGKAEKLALAKYRRVIWQGRVPNSQFTDEELRYQGRCPLTPEEIGLLLAALGFNNSTRLYLAIHEVYGGEARISTLRNLFPLLEDKKSLTSPTERAGIAGKASLSAAVDYYVSMHSDIFISASPGNMHNALLGHRAYLNMKTIRPNMVLLGQLFLNRSMEWAEFSQGVVDGHKNRQGQIRIRKEKQSIYTYPAPDCMCLHHSTHDL